MLRVEQTSNDYLAERNGHVVGRIVVELLLNWIDGGLCTCPCSQNQYLHFGTSLNIPLVRHREKSTLHYR